MNTSHTDYHDFLQLLEDVEMTENEYPVRGCYIWKPYGYAFKERVFETIESIYEDRDYDQYQFPRIVDGEPLEELAEEVQDFTDDVFWLANREGERTDRFMTPTGEAAFYQMFRKWISTESDLPLRAYQRGSTFRPRKNPNLILNNTEHMDVIEGHGAFQSAGALESEFNELYTTHTRIHRRLGLPYLALHRPRVGNNPTYVDMISFDTYLPSKRRTAYLGLIYKQSQIFSEALDVTFTRQSGEQDYTYQVNFGFTDRVAAAILDLHRDYHGLRLLPELAPIQISIIPVYDGKHNDELIAYAQEIKSVCSGYRVEVNTDDEYPSTMFNRAAKRGIPIQIRISPHDLGNETVHLVPRTQPESDGTRIGVSNLITTVNDWLNKIEYDIIDDSHQAFNKRIAPADSLRDVSELVRERYIAKMHWCGSEDCLRKLNDRFPGEILGTARFGPGGECLVCGEPAEAPTYFAHRTSSA